METGYKELKRKTDNKSYFEGRPIPLGMKIKVIFANTIMFIGIIFTFMGLIALLTFGSMVDFSSTKFKDNSPVADGKITAIVPTNSYVNDVQVFEYEFEYFVNSQKYTSKSYSTGNYFQNGQEVNIQYIENEPETARIEGTRRGAFEPWLLFVLMPFILIGGSMFGIRLMYGLRAIKLLQFGEIAFGKLIDTQPTNTKINNQTVYKLTFRFTASNGNTYEAISKTHQTYSLEDETEEKLVYDANNPEKAVMIDELPKAVKNFFQNLN